MMRVCWELLREYATYWTLCSVFEAEDVRLCCVLLEAAEGGLSLMKVLEAPKALYGEGSWRVCNLCLLEVLEMLKVQEAMRFGLLCTPRAVECGLCLLEVMRWVLFSNCSSFLVSPPSMRVSVRNGVGE